MARCSWMFLMALGCASLLGCEPDKDRDLGGGGDGTGTDTSGNGTGTDNPGTDGSGGTNGTGDEWTDTSVPTDTNVCEEQPFEIKRGAGRLMILQDLSFSMALDQRWEEGRAALKALLENDQFADIEFGFDFFPTNAANGCGINAAVPVDCAPGQAAQMSVSLDDIDYKEGATPLYCAMKSYLSDSYAPLFHAQDKPHFLLLVSDGQPTCPKECNKSNGTSVNPQDMGTLTGQLLDVGIKTMVIGFKYNDQDDPEYLTEIAQAGGTGYADYIPANDQAELEAALNDVAGAVVSCVFEVKATSAQADPGKVNFYFVKGGVEKVVGYDEGCQKGEGWMWTDSTHTYIEFCEQACDELKTGAVETVTAKFGCGSIVV